MNDDLARDLEHLRTHHAINEELIRSLLSGDPQQIRGHLQFFKRMSFGFNIALLTATLALAGWGARMDRIWMIGLGIVGSLWICRTFIRNIRAIRAVEIIAKKHDFLSDFI